VSTEISDSPGESKIGAPSVFVRARCNGSEDHRNSLQEPPHALCCNGCNKTKEKKRGALRARKWDQPVRHQSRERRASASRAKSKRSGGAEQVQRERISSAAGAKSKRSGGARTPWFRAAVVGGRIGFAPRWRSACAQPTHRGRAARAERTRRGSRANGPRAPSERAAGAEPLGDINLV
jgi:hypothetical protein